MSAVCQAPKQHMAIDCFQVPAASWSDRACGRDKNMACLQFKGSFRLACCYCRFIRVLGFIQGLGSVSSCRMAGLRWAKWSAWAAAPMVVVAGGLTYLFQGLLACAGWLVHAGRDGAHGQLRQCAQGCGCTGFEAHRHVQDGWFTLGEMECMGSCVNAPRVAIAQGLRLTGMCRMAGSR